MWFYLGFSFIKRSYFNEEHNAIHSTICDAYRGPAMAKQILLIPKILIFIIGAGKNEFITSHSYVFVEIWIPWFVTHGSISFHCNGITSDIRDEHWKNESSRSSCLKHTVAQSKVALLTAGRNFEREECSQRQTRVALLSSGTISKQLRTYPVWYQQEQIQSRALGTVSDSFYFVSCGKFLWTIVCYKECHCLRKHDPVAPLDRGSGYVHMWENKQNCVFFIFIYNFPLKLVSLN